MRRDVAIGVAGGLWVLLGWVWSPDPEAATPSPAEAIAPPAAEATPEVTEPHARVPHTAELPDTGRLGPAATPPPAYRAKLRKARAAFEADAPDESAATERAEQVLGEALRDAMSPRAASLGLKEGLRVECRSRHCRLGVPIRERARLDSLPVVMQMVEALERAQDEIASVGDVTVRYREQAPDTGESEYVLYLRRSRSPADPEG